MRRKPAPRLCWRGPGRPEAAWRSSSGPRPSTASWPWFGRSRRRDERARRSCERFLDQPLDQLAIGDALELRLLGHKAQRGHARLCVDLEQVDARLAQLVIPSKVGTRGALAAKQLVGAGGHVHHRAGYVVGDLGRADVLRQAVGVLGIVIVEAGLWLQLR